MQYLNRIISSAKVFYNDINSANLCGAIDVVIVQHPNGEWVSSPFYVQFGKTGVFRPCENEVEVRINGVLCEKLDMRLNQFGQAYFHGEEQLDSITTESEISKDVMNSISACNTSETSYVTNSINNDINKEELAFIDLLSSLYQSLNYSDFKSYVSWWNATEKYNSPIEIYELPHKQNSIQTISELKPKKVIHEESPKSDTNLPKFDLSTETVEDLRLSENKRVWVYWNNRWSSWKTTAIRLCIIRNLQPTIETSLERKLQNMDNEDLDSLLLSDLYHESKLHRIQQYCGLFDGGAMKIAHATKLETDIYKVISIDTKVRGTTNPESVELSSEIIETSNNESSRIYSSDCDETYSCNEDLSIVMPPSIVKNLLLEGRAKKKSMECTVELFDANLLTKSSLEGGEKIDSNQNTLDYTLDDKLIEFDNERSTVPHSANEIGDAMNRLKLTETEAEAETEIRKNDAIEQESELGGVISTNPSTQNDNGYPFFSTSSGKETHQENVLDSMNEDMHQDDHILGSDSNPTCDDPSTNKSVSDQKTRSSKSCRPGDENGNLSELLSAQLQQKNWQRYKNTSAFKLSSEKLKSLDLNEGINEAEFAVTNKYQGTCSCHCLIYLWRSTDKIVVTDIDGTITRSDILGHLMPMVGFEWIQPSVVDLYRNISDRGYKIMYVSARAIGQANTTRRLLENVVQNDKSLPPGPIILSPNSVRTSIKMEVIKRRPQELKIEGLKIIGELFRCRETECPFICGFGNRTTDVDTYRAIGIPDSHIFIVNPSGAMETVTGSRLEQGYKQLNEMVSSMFPINGSEYESFRRDETINSISDEESVE